MSNLSISSSLHQMKAFNKGFAKTNQWVWISPPEIEAKKVEATSLNFPVSNCQRFCYNNQFRVMFFQRQTDWGQVGLNNFYLGRF